MQTETTIDSVLDQVMHLSPDNRLELAEILVASVPIDEEIEAEQLEEVRRRIAADRAGLTTRIPGPEALRQVREAVLGKA